MFSERCLSPIFLCCKKSFSKRNRIICLICHGFTIKAFFPYFNIKTGTYEYKADQVNSQLSNRQIFIFSRLFIESFNIPDKYVVQRKFTHSSHLALSCCQHATLQVGIALMWWQSYYHQDMCFCTKEERKNRASNN